MLRVISLGAGVQSTTLALLAAHGSVQPTPDCAIFADTGWEPDAVYKHLRWLQQPAILPFPIHVVSARNIRADIIATSAGEIGNRPSIPWFTIDTSGKKGHRLRQCTERYKVQPILKKVRELLGVGPRAPIKPAAVEMWMGISTDEAARARHSPRQFIENRYPLIDMEMSRSECSNWLRANDYPEPPKSACIGCPFHNNEMWAAMQKDDPLAWDDAVEIDRLLRSGSNGKMRGVPFMHSSRMPLSQVQFASGAKEPNYFNNECEGMCGV